MCFQLFSGHDLWVCSFSELNRKTKTCCRLGSKYRNKLTQNNGIMFLKCSFLLKPSFLTSLLLGRVMIADNVDTWSVLALYDWVDCPDECQTFVTSTKHQFLLRINCTNICTSCFAKTSKFLQLLLELPRPPKLLSPENFTSHKYVFKKEKFILFSFRPLLWQNLGLQFQLVWPSQPGQVYWSAPVGNFQESWYVLTDQAVTSVETSN